MFPGNLYNYGSPMPPVIDETTPMRPSSRKGRLRVAIEDRMAEATERGMRAIILRAGDFFGGGRGSWLDLVLAKEIGRGRLTYPGPHRPGARMGLSARSGRGAGASRRRFATGSPPFATFGFPGHAVTGREFITAIARATGSGLQIKRMTWWLIHALRPIRAAVPGAVGDGVSLARAASHRRKQAPVGDRRRPAYAA